MIITDVFFAVKCDRCGKVNNETDTAFWNEESIADEMAKESDWLCNIPGKHYFPECYTVNDLACFCPLNKPCHVDILIKMLQ